MAVSAEHQELTLLGARWLRKNGFSVVATELTCFGSRERPDVIGFRSSSSAVIEVKVSRADFLADLKKPERSVGGLGVYRFYLCPAGDIIRPSDLPPKWGLLHATKRGISSVVAPSGNWWPGLSDLLQIAHLPKEAIGDWPKFQHQPDEAAERRALFSIARRLSCK